jgi:hypothetical protein
MGALERRLARLEANIGRSSAALCVWCHDEVDCPAVVDAMIAAREIAPADRARCVPWWAFNGRPTLTHEAGLAILEAPP